MLIGPIVAKLIDIVMLQPGSKPETMEEDFEGAGGSQVIVVGFGRFGQVVTQALLLQHIDVTIIDSDVERIRSAAQFGFRIYYGDGTRLDVLRAAERAARAKIICGLHRQPRGGAAHRRDGQARVPDRRGCMCAPMTASTPST